MKEINLTLHKQTILVEYDGVEALIYEIESEVPITPDRIRDYFELRGWDEATDSITFLDMSTVINLDIAGH